MAHEGSQEVSLAAKRKADSARGICSHSVPYVFADGTPFYRQWTDDSCVSPHVDVGDPVDCRTTVPQYAWNVISSNLSLRFQPPDNVQLSDSAVAQLMHLCVRGQMTTNELHRRWASTFNADGFPHLERRQMGEPAVIFDGRGVPRYPRAGNGYILCGEAHAISMCSIPEWAAITHTAPPGWCAPTRGSSSRKHVVRGTEGNAGLVEIDPVRLTKPAGYLMADETFAVDTSCVRFPTVVDLQRCSFEKKCLLRSINSLPCLPEASREGIVKAVNALADHPLPMEEKTYARDMVFAAGVPYPVHMVMVAELVAGDVRNVSDYFIGWAANSAQKVYQGFGFECVPRHRSHIAPYLLPSPPDLKRWRTTTGPVASDAVSPIRPPPPAYAEAVSGKSEEEQTVRQPTAATTDLAHVEDENDSRRENGLPPVAEHRTATWVSGTPADRNGTATVAPGIRVATVAPAVFAMANAAASVSMDLGMAGSHSAGTAACQFQTIAKGLRAEWGMIFNGEFGGRANRVSLIERMTKMADEAALEQTRTAASLSSMAQHNIHGLASCSALLGLPDLKPKPSIDLTGVAGMDLEAVPRDKRKLAVKSAIQSRIDAGDMCGTFSPLLADPNEEVNPFGPMINVPQYRELSKQAGQRAVNRFVAEVEVPEHDPSVPMSDGFVDIQVRSDLEMQHFHQSMPPPRQDASLPPPGQNMLPSGQHGPASLIPTVQEAMTPQPSRVLPPPSPIHPPWTPTQQPGLDAPKPSPATAPQGRLSQAAIASQQSSAFGTRGRDMFSQPPQPHAPRRTQPVQGPSTERPEGHNAPRQGHLIKPSGQVLAPSSSQSSECRSKRARSVSPSEGPSSRRARPSIPPPPPDRPAQRVHRSIRAFRRSDLGRAHPDHRSPQNGAAMTSVFALSGADVRLPHLDASFPRLEASPNPSTAQSPGPAMPQPGSSSPLDHSVIPRPTPPTPLPNPAALPPTIPSLSTHPATPQPRAAPPQPSGTRLESTSAFLQPNPTTNPAVPPPTSSAPTPERLSSPFGPAPPPTSPILLDKGTSPPPLSNLPRRDPAALSSSSQTDTSLSSKSSRSSPSSHASSQTTAAPSSFTSSPPPSQPKSDMGGHATSSSPPPPPPSLDDQGDVAIESEDVPRADNRRPHDVYGSGDRDDEAPIKKESVSSPIF